MTKQFFDTLPSTNQYCELLDLSQVEEFAVFVAREQTAGIGQRGNVWESEAGKNLTFSMVLKPTWLPAAEQYGLTKAVSLGLADALSEMMPAGERVSIKWPNDIYVGRKKICGILISNKLKGNMLCASIVGVGLNVNQRRFAEWVPNPVSLSQLTGCEHDLDGLLERVAEAVIRRYGQLREGVPMDGEYLGCLLNMGMEAGYRYRGGAIRATITGVNRFGHLELRQADGAPLVCQLKEIAFVL